MRLFAGTFGYHRWNTLRDHSGESVDGNLSSDTTLAPDSDRQSLGLRMGKRADRDAVKNRTPSISNVRVAGKTLRTPSPEESWWVTRRFANVDETN